jgi:hypothetical protein
MGNDEYEAVIADLEAQIAELQMTVAVLRKRAGMSPDGGGGGGPGGREIHSATFLNKSIPEAARIYLEMCNKRPQKVEQIAEALQRGGMTSKAANFVSMLQTILRRTEIQTGEFMRTPNGEWILPEWVGKKAMPKAEREKEEAAAGAEPKPETTPEGAASDKEEKEKKAAS